MLKRTVLKRTVLMRAALALGWVLVAVMAVLLVAPHAMPPLTGHRLLIVDGGSMVPTMHPGDILLAAPPTGDDLRVGAILVVGTPPAGYTHRVIEVRGSADSHDNTSSPGTAGLRARLQGDANATADPHWVSQADVTALPVATLTGPAAAAARVVLQRPGSLILAAALIACTALLLMPRRRSATE